MYIIFYIMSAFLTTAYQPFRSAAIAIPRAGKACLKLGRIAMKAVFAMGCLFVLAAACHPAGSGAHEEAPRAVEHAQAPHESGDVTIDFQGGRMDCSESGVLGFYDISLEAFAGGPDKVDLETYKEKTFAFMREGMSRDGIPAEQIEAWIDHIKDIPRQMVEIVSDDPKVLESCENFSTALSGPP
jgi:hypothetical protein